MGKRNPEQYKTFGVPAAYEPVGESFDDIINRLRAALELLADRHVREYPGCDACGRFEDHRTDR